MYDSHSSADRSFGSGYMTTEVAAGIELSGLLIKFRTSMAFGLRWLARKPCFSLSFFGIIRNHQSWRRMSNGRLS